MLALAHLAVRPRPHGLSDQVIVLELGVPLELYEVALVVDHARKIVLILNTIWILPLALAFTTTVIAHAII